MRIGHGYDVHALREGRELWLGGVHIPHTSGLLGHSDADAALHALMDALLGAAALGDIGRHFPDNDDRYLGISSLLLLEEVGRLISGAGYTLANADITIVAQAPKLAPHIPEMVRVTAQTLGVPEDRINYKATTEEHLGFTGAKQGIAAHAVVLLEELR